MKHVVMFSGGIGSWAAAKRVAEKHGTENLFLLFTDTLIEDEDLYRFLREAAENVGGELVWIADGRTPWDVFRDVRYVGNSRIAPCSHILKQQQARNWVTNNCKPDDSILYIGIDWSEEHRFRRAKDHWKPYRLEAPLCEEPYLSKEEVFDLLASEGITPPRLYEAGFSHNNCGGFCVRAGQSQFKRLLQVFPDRYRYHELEEQKMREFLDRDVSILREQRNYIKYPLTLRTLRERIESQQSIPEFDWGGCGCFVDDGVENLEEIRGIDDDNR